MERPALIVYGNKEYKLLKYLHGPKNRLVSDIYLNFSHNPSMGLAILTSEADANRIEEQAERDGVKCVRFTNFPKALHTLKRCLGF